MACCLTAPSHYLNQCRLIISEGHNCGIHLRAISQEMLKIHILDMDVPITNLRLWPHLPGANEFNHWGQVTHIGITKLGHYCFRWWFVACLVPSHYLSQCYFIVDWIIANIFQRHCNQNTTFSFKKMLFKMSSTNRHLFCLDLNVLTPWGLMMPYGNRDLCHHWLR